MRFGRKLPIISQHIVRYNVKKTSLYSDINFVRSIISTILFIPVPNISFARLTKTSKNVTMEKDLEDYQVLFVSFLNIVLPQASNK